MKAINSDTGDQTTTYAYGVTLTNSEIASNDLLASVTYPDSGTVSREYNRQGQRIKMTDQIGSVHVYSYDSLGRPTKDVITTLGSGVDGAVRRIEQSYDNRLRPENVTSYSAVISGSVTSDVQYEYNDFGQPTTEYQQHGSAVNTSTSPDVTYNYANGSANTIRPTGITYPSNTALTIDYGSSENDELSRVEQLTFDSTDVVDYTYLGGGQVVVQEFPEPSANVVYEQK